MGGSMRGFGSVLKSYFSKDYSALSATREGEYYEWQKITNVDLHIRRVWRAHHDWQMLTKTEEEQQTLTTKDDIDVHSILQEALDSSLSEEKQQSVKQILEMSKQPLKHSFASSREKSRSPRRLAADSSGPTPSRASNAGIPPLPEPGVILRVL